MAVPLAISIVAFWRDAGPDRWYAKDDAFDAALRTRFEAAHHAAARGEFSGWSADWEGSLALLILLDQVPRNIYRGSAHAFATDPLARSIANSALEAGHDQAAPPDLRAFFYLPFEHSERIEDQDRCVALCEALQAAGGPPAEWALMHRDIIRRFGRFPHRNPALGRTTAAEEQAFLDSGGFRG
ncbi:MAG: DUF924 family protein [Novosphingobium sp.]|uniref:DUF924 family protein n=1 Tax=Novosphingobium sp. TaxID=1874826 RepID=UPI00184B5576|nr:DUF924 family protein [Novosphingobium sp.]